MELFKLIKSFPGNKILSHHQKLHCKRMFSSMKKYLKGGKHISMECTGLTEKKD